MPEGRFRSPSGDALLADELVRRLRARGGLTTLLHSAGPELTRRYGSTDAFLAVRDLVHHTGSLWTCSGHSDATHSFGYSEPPVAVLDEYFAGPVGDWLLLRDASSSSAVSWRLFLHDTGFVDPPSDVLERCQRLICRRPLATLISVQIPSVGDWTGRFMIVNAFPDQAVLILSAIAHLARQVGPTILAKHQQRLLRRLVRVEERAFLARELHDGVIQSMIGLGMRLNVAMRKVGQGAAARELGAIERELREQVAALREITEKLRAADFDPSRLLRQFEDMVERFGRETGIAATFGGEIDELDITPSACREVVRIVQEALANVRRHSGARSVRVALSGCASEWVMQIEDDGKGFPFSGRLTLEDLERTFQGPRVIKERVRALGGELTIDSTTRGARMEIRIPIATRHAVA